MIASHSKKQVRRFARTFASIVPLAACIVAVDASAQMTVTQRGDNGIKVGAGRLHPLLGFETRYDSYVGLSQEQPQGADPSGIGDLILHVKPGFELTVPSDSVEIGARFLLDYNAYMGQTESWTTDLSKTRASFDFGALVNPKGDVKVGFTERFARTDINTNLALPVLSVSDRNDAGVSVEITPGGGAVMLKPAYVNTYEHFESRDGDPTTLALFDYMQDYMQHTVGLTVGYKLQPEAALLLDVAAGIRNYEREASQQYDNTSVRATVGFAGMVMPKVSLVAKAGFGTQIEGSDAPADTSGFQSAIGQLELGYLASENTELRVGYARSFEPTPSAGLYYSDDRIYLDARARMAQRLLLRAGVSYDMIDFPERTSDTTDELIGFMIGPDWEFNSVFTAGISYGFTQRTSDLPVAGYDYDRHEVGVHVVAYY
ncbi:MAG TPA: outer membrane beta-barrel protein [Vulgatibacter sp.]|nr:outer membrane beta-barrel protein [Vulgatibacter sp.]